MNTDTEKKKTNYSLNYKKIAIIGNQKYWAEYKQIEYPNEAMDLFIDGIIQCEEKSKRNQVKDKNVPRKEWITRALLKSCKKGTNNINNLKKIQ